MKRLRLFFILLNALMLLSGEGVVRGQDIGASGFPEAGLPSEQTYSAIESSSSVSHPALRAKPGDIDGWEKPQKVPLGEVNMMILALSPISILLYKITRTQTRRNREL